MYLSMPNVYGHIHVRIHNNAYILSSVLTYVYAQLYENISQYVLIYTDIKLNAVQTKIYK